MKTPCVEQSHLTVKVFSWPFIFKYLHVFISLLVIFQCLSCDFEDFAPKNLNMSPYRRLNNQTSFKHLFSHPKRV